MKLTDILKPFLLHKDHKVFRDQLVIKEYKDNRVYRVLKVIKVIPVHRDLLEQMV